MDNSRNRDDGGEHIGDSAAELYPPAMSKGKRKEGKRKREE